MRVELRTLGRLKICVLLIFLAACLSIVYGQRAAQKKSKTESPQARGRTLFTQDIHGSAWFDDVTVSQVPRVKIRTDRPGNIFRRGDPLRRVGHERKRAPVR